MWVGPEVVKGKFGVFQGLQGGQWARGERYHLMLVGTRLCEALQVKVRSLDCICSCLRLMRCLA